jgi:DNA-binding transcriptional MerR regulator
VTERFHIGGLAKRTGRSVHTIRWYETQGLIPRVERDGGGRRVYESDHVDQLVFLDRMRRAGMSVAEMRRLTALGLAGWRTLEQRQALLLAHRAQVEGRIRELRAALTLIDEKVDYYDQWARQKKRPAPPIAARSRGAP